MAEKIRVFVNGASGRIGRFVTHHLAQMPGVFKIVGLNDPLDKDPEKNLSKFLHNLTRRDSTHGTLNWGDRPVALFPRDNSTKTTSLFLNQTVIPVYNEVDLRKIPFKELGVQILEECSGYYDGKLGNPHAFLEAGVERVVMSYPAKVRDVTLIMGVNHDAYDPEKHRLISNASCTTKAMAGPLKMLMDYGLDIQSVQMNTIHAATNSQRVQDTGDDVGVLNTISTHKTGAAEALAQVIPSLEGKMTGMSYRVPVSDGSFAHMCLVARKRSPNLDADKLNNLLDTVVRTDYRYAGRVGMHHGKEFATSEFIGDTRNSIIVPSKTQVHALGDNLYHISLVAAYDNERGPPMDQVLLSEHIGRRSGY
ncbi:hypothetical protein HYZ97_01215 [Candidatus Pacearchaeota archaeon]|nr:hypothetical protein [Candidatus Pacearchaeota archaeon]